MTKTSAPPPFDAPKLIAQMRAGDERAIAEAYRWTFGNELGRLVLAHHLAECGVGGVLGREDLPYQAGRHDAAVHLASKAGFDQTSLAVAVLTDDLQGEQHDRHYDDNGSILDDS